MLQVVGIQPLRTHLDRRQATVAEWVATQIIFKVCAQKDTGYSREGRRQAPWWRQLTADSHLRATSKAIFEAAKERRQQESGRLGDSKERQDSGSEGYGFSMLGKIRGTPRWADDTVWTLDGRQREETRGKSWTTYRK